MEVTDARRTSTALSWFSDFTESTEREPFVDPSAPGGAAYNLETLVLLAEFIRRGGSRHTSRPDKVLRAGTIEGYVGAIRALRSREAGREIAPEPAGGRG
eukprot:1379260-Pleurochrysis_carterae.AAC.1